MLWSPRGTLVIRTTSMETERPAPTRTDSLVGLLEGFAQTNTCIPSMLGDLRRFVVCAFYVFSFMLHTR